MARRKTPAADRQMMERLLRKEINRKETNDE
jgi:hypothetical protein